MNIIEGQVKDQGGEGMPLFGQVYQELLTELLRSVTNTQHKVQQ